MKKKMIFAVATGLFAVATVFNMNLLQGNSAGDVSLDAIAVMAQAQSEGGSGGGDWRYVWVVVEENVKCPNNKYKTGVKLSCTRVLSPPEDATGCSSEGSVMYWGCY
jgi:hypothetical protein